MKTFKNTAAMQFITQPEEQEPTPAPTPAKEKKPSKKKPAAPKIPEGYKMVKVSKSIRMQLLVRPLTKTKLKEVADNRGISVNALINDILEDYLERQGNK